MIVEQLGAYVNTQRSSLQFTGAQNTLLVQVTQRSAEGYFTNTATHAQGVVGTDAGLVDLVLPVGAGATQEIFLIAGPVGIYIPAEFIGRQYIYLVGRRGDGKLRIEVEAGLSCPALLGGNNDHTVGSARTIDGCRRGIL